MFLGVLANAFFAILGRSINRESKLEPVVITVISMVRLNYPICNKFNC